MVFRYKGIHAFDNNKTITIIYSMHRADEVSVHRACCERATQPYSLGGGGTIYPGSRPARVTTRCPRMVTVFTHSLDVKKGGASLFFAYIWQSLFLKTNISYDYVTYAGEQNAL